MSCALLSCFMNAGAAMFTGFNAPSKKKMWWTLIIWTCSLLDVRGHILFFNWLVLGNLLWGWLLGCFGCFVIGWLLWLLWSWLLGRLLWGWLVGGEVATIRPYLSHSAFPAKSCKPCWTGSSQSCKLLSLCKFAIVNILCMAQRWAVFNTIWSSLLLSFCCKKSTSICLHRVPTKV